MCRRGIVWIGKRFLLCAASLLLLALLCTENQAKAAEGVTVTEAKAVLYSVDGTCVYNYPDVNATIIATLQANVPVEVLGVTSNGWFQVNINGKYYISGAGLVGTSSEAVSKVTSYDDVAIKRMIRGTFSFFDNAKLRSFTASDIEEMDENTYLKYLDSFLNGNAMIDYCIMKDSGLVLKSHYDGKVQADASIGNKTMKQYLVDYRMAYLNQSILGPARTKRGMVLIMNRAIRYERTEFTTIYRNASIGSDAEQMETLLKEIVAEMKEEQGITFTYKKSYGNYTTENGQVGTGWNIVWKQAK